MYLAVVFIRVIWATKSIQNIKVQKMHVETACNPIYIAPLNLALSYSNLCYMTKQFSQHRKITRVWQYKHTFFELLLHSQINENGVCFSFEQQCGWGICSSVIWYYITGWLVNEIFIQRGCWSIQKYILTLEDESTKFFQNTWKPATQWHSVISQKNRHFVDSCVNFTLFDCESLSSYYLKIVCAYCWNSWIVISIHTKIFIYFIFLFFFPQLAATVFYAMIILTRYPNFAVLCSHYR